MVAMTPRIDRGHQGTSARRRGIARILLISVLATQLALAANSSRNEDGPAAQLSKAPSSARAMRNPFADQPQAAAAGRKLYQQHCAQCHGGEAHGLERAADLHSRTIQTAPDGSLFWALRNGRLRQGMPSWARLPDQQLWQLVTYLKTLR
jgi:mono/diheme cytochrome c family protein